MKTFSQYMTEGLTDVLYHGTELKHAHSMISSNVLRFSYTDVDPTKQRGLGKYYFSMARSPSSYYINREILRDTAWPVIIVFDGKILQSRFKAGPHNYWFNGDTGFRHKKRYSEMEDRLWSDTEENKLPKGAVIKVFAIFSSDHLRSQRKSLRLRNLKMMREIQRRVPFQFLDTGTFYNHGDDTDNRRSAAAKIPRMIR